MSALKGLPEIARETKDLVLRAKGGALRAEELSDGTFTITNLGAYGIETLIGIIQPPQTAILGVGSVLDQPAVREGVVGVKQLMKVALSADHRVTDGAQGAQFLGEIKALLSNRSDCCCSAPCARDNRQQNGVSSRDGPMVGSAWDEGSLICQPREPSSVDSGYCWTRTRRLPSGSVMAAIVGPPGTSKGWLRTVPSSSVACAMDARRSRTWM